MFTGNYNSMNMLGMNNMFGMNYLGSNNILGQLFSGSGSIFNQSGFNPLMMGGSGCSIFTNCNGQPNWGAMAGFGVGMTVMNVITGAFGHHLVTKKAESQSTVEADVKGLYELKDDLLEKYDSTEDEINKFDIEKSNEAKVYKEACGAYDTNEKNIKAYTDDKTNIDKIIDLYTKTTLAQGETKPTKEVYDAAKAKKDEYTEAIANRKKLEDAKSDALKDKEALEKKMKEAKKELEDINDKIKNAQAVLDDKNLDKAIGKEKKLISDEIYKNAVGTHTDDVKNNEVQFTKDHLRKAASKYRKAATPEQKASAKKDFNLIYDWLFNNTPSEITKDLEAIANMMA